MNRSTEIIHSLRVLGLPPDATASEVRAAFRRLARTCHPDVAGKRNARKFERIISAYTSLKGLPEEELQQAAPSRPEEAGASPPRRWLWRWRKKKTAVYSPQKRTHAESDEERRERAMREEAEAEKAKKEAARVAAADAILTEGERAAVEFFSQAEQEALRRDIKDFTLRLSSAVPQVRHLALSRLGALSNRRDILDATLAMLQKWDIDEKTARLVPLLPLEPENRRWLARRLADRASDIPNSLLSFLLQLQSPPTTTERDVWEQYLPKAGATGAAMILRRWPHGLPMPEHVLRQLLSREEEAVLVPLFCAMKQRSIPCPTWSRNLLNASLSHPSVAVRVWAKNLLSQR